MGTSEHTWDILGAFECLLTKDPKFCCILLEDSEVFDLSETCRVYEIERRPMLNSIPAGKIPLSLSAAFSWVWKASVSQHSRKKTAGQWPWMRTFIVGLPNMIKVSCLPCTFTITISMHWSDYVQDQVVICVAGRISIFVRRWWKERTRTGRVTFRTGKGELIKIYYVLR